jgi:hypothetical protein
MNDREEIEFSIFDVLVAKFGRRSERSSAVNKEMETED